MNNPINLFRVSFVDVMHNPLLQVNESSICLEYPRNMNRFNQECIEIEWMKYAGHIFLWPG